MTPDELGHFEQIRLVLDDGEASCLAVALTRNGTLFSDDRDARRYAARLGVSVSGTLGTLALCARKRHLTLDQANSLLADMIREGYHSPINVLEEVYDFDD